MAVQTGARAQLTRSVNRLGRFVDQFRRSKRGLLGVGIICFFIVLAMSAPLLAPYDPIFPQWKGYFPAGNPPLAAEVCVPAWYKYIPGMNVLSENMEPLPDYKFASESSLNNWTLDITDPDLIDLKYNAVNGTLNDGCLEISYGRQAGDTVARTSSISLTCNFSYPYPTYPRRFWIHTSYFLTGTVSPEVSVDLNFSFYRTDTSQLEDYRYPPSLIRSQGPFTVYEYPLINYTYTSPDTEWKHMWTRSTHPTIFYDAKWTYTPERTIFPHSGNYTLQTCVVFRDYGTPGEKNVTVYVDNLDLLMYGTAFGYLGTDDNPATPRDLYSSIVWGSRVSITIGLLSASISVSIGLLVGLTAGYTRGLTDEVLMRIADLLMVLPTLPLLIVLSFILSPSIWNVVGILAFLGWMGFSRSVRSMTLSIRERTFVEAARVVGAGRGHILLRHVLPNVFPLVYLALATAVPGAIVTEASLSFLGLFDPDVMSWGRIINEFTRSGVATTKGFNSYWFWVLPPGISISMLAISFILVGYALDEMLNPKLRMRR